MALVLLLSSVNSISLLYISNIHHTATHSYSFKIHLNYSKAVLLIKNIFIFNCFQVHPTFVLFTRIIIFIHTVSFPY